MITQGFFSDTRHQKRSLAGLNEYFGNEVAGKKNKLATKVGSLEMPSIETIKPYPMIRRTLFIVCILLAGSCGSSNSIDSFYNSHKDDDQVMAIRGPQAMLSLVGGISPQMDALVGNTRDLRYMQFPSATPARTQFLNKQMNHITGNSFIEVFRKNDELKRNVVSIREKRNTVKEILIYNNNNLNGSFLYFNGDFDPVKVREMAKNNEFEKLTDGLLQQFGPRTPGVVNE